MSVPYFSVVYHTVMLNFINNVLCHFESCFSRKASFRWFVAITIGLMLRSDKLGVTSVIRDLALSPHCYDSMIHFFRASSWSLDIIRERWFSAVKKFSPLYKEGELLRPCRGRCEAVQGRTAHAGGKEAVPGVRKLRKTGIHPWPYVRRPRHPGRECPQLGLHSLKYPPS